ncbi:RNA-directed DNA polymerase, eukaryota, nucleotide-binding alpha-beta plait domain protein, partial [Tanacetum coccineum]
NQIVIRESQEGQEIKLIDEQIVGQVPPPLVLDPSQFLDPEEDATNDDQEDATDVGVYVVVVEQIVEQYVVVEFESNVIVCSGYGTVVDVFIPNKRSKAGKRFAFVRFIKVLNFDRLIENLKTIWIGRFHLSANPARFERPKAPIPQKEMSAPSGIASGLKQPIAQHQGGPKGTNFAAILKPSLVLDDSCLVLLFNEGFHNTRIVYLGGLWVMIELNSSKSKLKFMEHVGVASWFQSLGNAQSDFAAKERIVWVDIEGVPLNAWSRSTFQKIGSKWGELVVLEDGYEDLFARKRICIMTSHTENILESFKLIVKGKVFWARAKELFVWSPSFKEVPEQELCSDDDFCCVHG